MSVHVQTKERDGMKETLFKDAYALDAKISYTTYNDAEWNWDKVVINFVDSLGKNYGLIEFFMDGANNDTAFVMFEYTDKEGKLRSERYDANNCKKGEIFVTAEKRMVNMMRRRLRGEE